MSDESSSADLQECTRAWSNNVRVEVGSLNTIAELRTYSENGDFLLALNELRKLRVTMSLYHSDDDVAFVTAWASGQPHDVLVSGAVNWLRRAYLDFWYRVVDCVLDGSITSEEAQSLRNFQLVPMCAELTRARALITDGGLNWYAKAHVDQHADLDAALRQADHSGDYHSGNPNGKATMNERLLWLHAHHAGLAPSKSMQYALAPTFLAQLEGCPAKSTNADGLPAEEREVAMCYMLAPQFDAVDIDAWFAAEEPKQKKR